MSLKRKAEFSEEVKLIHLLRCGGLSHLLSLLLHFCCCLFVKGQRKVKEIEAEETKPKTTTAKQSMNVMAWMQIPCDYAGIRIYASHNTSAPSLSPP